MATGSASSFLFHLFPDYMMLTIGMPAFCFLAHVKAELDKLESIPV